MVILYDLVFVVFAIIYLPYFLLKKKLHKGFIQRLGFLPANLRLENPVWIHAVSVGEARVAEVLVKQLRQAYPQERFVFSTVTSTGNRIVCSFQSEGDFVFYLPLDLSFVTKRVIRKLHPRICIIIETEIWPNLITGLSKMDVPIVLINARISDSSFWGYRAVKPLMKPILDKINLFCVRSQNDAQRLSSLGVASHKLKVTGNMKYDISDSTSLNTDYHLTLGLTNTEQLFVAGSTHPGEEEIVLNVYRMLINEFPGLRLLIAPRHPERSCEIETLIQKSGFKTSRISNLDRQTGRPADQQTIFLLDTIGQLMHFYAIADIVFVGGSLVKKGGHNILEPALFQKAIIFGPNMFNFRDMTDLFLPKNAARMVHSQDELLEQVRFLLKNPDELVNMGKAARRLILDNQGATTRNIEAIKAIDKRISR